MQSQAALAVLAELRSLALHDEERLAASKERLARAEQEVTAARAAFDSANARAEVSQKVALGAEELLVGVAQAGDDVLEPPCEPAGWTPGGARPTLGQVMAAYVRAQGGRGVSRAEIAGHVSVARPDLRVGGVGPELTELVRAGVLVRLERGIYGIPQASEAGDA
ncbi:hypothetical protein [Streptomyces sp. NPDC127114]|uniref:hypothetical protein n=1 Tax=Streptomyces sp. NPDC127114 TaxID=3345366 RepID=UPI00363CD317